MRRRLQLDPEGAPLRISVGLIAAPGLPAELAEHLALELEERLGGLHSESTWAVEPVVDGLVDPPAHATELIDTAHRRLMGEQWELAIVLTDLPLRIGRRAVVGHASPSHRVAVVSVPALGPARLRRRALDTAVGLLSILLGQTIDDGEDKAGRPARAAHLQRRLVDLSELAERGTTHGAAGLAALVRGGRLRLLWGMVWANRPWRLTARLYRALAAALVTVAASSVLGDVWIVADSLGFARLTALTLLSVGIMVVSLIAAHGLWERGGGGRARDQVFLFNAATAITVSIGVLCLYAALFLLSLAGVGLMVTPELLSEELHEDVGVGDYVTTAWLISSLATVGGGLGAALESDEAIREAAYGHRPASQAALPAGEAG